MMDLMHNEVTSCDARKKFWSKVSALVFYVVLSERVVQNNENSTCLNGDHKTL